MIHHYYELITGDSSDDDVTRASRNFDLYLVCYEVKVRAGWGWEEVEWGRPGIKGEMGERIQSPGFLNPLLCPVWMRVRDQGSYIAAVTISLCVATLEETKIDMGVIGLHSANIYHTFQSCTTYSIRRRMR